jgi:ATP-dependent DNA helicase RecG
MNALAHRDYSLSGSTVDITVWDDRIEIQSPGPLPGHITLANMRKEHYSRNRRIMRVLKTAALVEEYGEGIDRMFQAMEARLMEPPIFVATPSSVTVTLRNRFLVAVEDQVWLSLLGQYQLSAGERRALVAARHEGGVTPRRLRELVLNSNADSIIAGAVAKGLLVRLGERDGTRYELTDEVVLRAGSQGIEARTRHRQLLLDEIRKRGSLSTGEGASLLSEEMTVTRQLLNDLARAQLIRAEGRTRARRYYPA